MIKRKRTRDHSHVRRNTAQEMEMEERSEREEGKGGSGSVFDMRNQWYPVVFASELPRRAGSDAKPTEPYGFQLLGDPIVLFRDEHGAAQCVQDKCPHRSAPLSVGTVRGGRLECKVRSAMQYNSISFFFVLFISHLTTNIS
jgi:nitrite reductase/ring-hydroxylating ferredoxin subunit